MVMEQKHQLFSAEVDKNQQRILDCNFQNAGRTEQSSAF
jgi:hypothetical protein